MRGPLSRRRRLQTHKSSGQQLPKERRPSLDSSRCTCRPMASSSLHQPSLPQGSGPDWLLSSPAHDKRDSHRLQWLLWLWWLLLSCVVVVCCRRCVVVVLSSVLPSSSLLLLLLLLLLCGVAVNVCCWCCWC